jgi:four helix bundle protein
MVQGGGAEERDAMVEPGYAASYRDLAVYRKARSVATSIFALSKSFPREETYSLTDQIRRSSRAVGTQIAESWGKRRYEKHFVSKLSDADSENYETQHWLDIAVECGYVPEAQARAIVKDLYAIGAMLYSMVRKSDLFCQPDSDRVREDLAEYIVTETEG